MTLTPQLTMWRGARKNYYFFTHFKKINKCLKVFFFFFKQYQNNNRLVKLNGIKFSTKKKKLSQSDIQLKRLDPIFQNIFFKETEKVVGKETKELVIQSALKEILCSRKTMKLKKKESRVGRNEGNLSSFCKY